MADNSQEPNSDTQTASPLPAPLPFPDTPNIDTLTALHHELENTPGTMRSDAKLYPKLAPKTQAMAILTAAGMDPTVAYTTLNGKKKDVKRNVKYAERMCKSFVLAQPRRVKTAAQVIDETMAMTPKVVDIEGKKTVVIPTISNRLEAAKQVLDRADVVPQVRVSVDYSPLEMAEFVLVPDNTVIEQVPIPTKPTNE